jgi:hypothetical protein
MDPTCLASNGGFAPTNLPLFQGVRFGAGRIGKFMELRRGRLHTRQAELRLGRRARANTLNLRQVSAVLQKKTDHRSTTDPDEFRR